MKRVFLIILSAAIIFSFAACSKNNSDIALEETDEYIIANPGDIPENAPSDDTAPLSVLRAAWDSFSKENSTFPILGGTMLIEGAPANYDIADTVALTEKYLFPTDLTSKINGAATITHKNDSDLFTCVAVSFDDIAQLDQAAEAIKTNVKIKNTIEQLVIIKLDSTLVYIFGESIVVDIFKSHIPGGTIYFDEIMSL